MQQNRIPPRRDTSEINELAIVITDQLAVVIPGMVKDISRSLREAGSSIAGNQGNSNEGSYKSFMACKPIEFCGTKGAAELMQWIEKMENTLDISKCPKNQKVKFASCSFHKRALTWWNSQLRARGRDAALAMAWAEFVEILKGEFYPKNELPHMVTPLSKLIDSHVTRCEKFGHWTAKCNIPRGNNNNNAVVVAPATNNGGNNNNRACYERGDPNHFRNRSPS
ncbi:hypothetical protein R6Q59_025128 [Mikania micrantha]